MLRASAVRMDLHCSNTQCENCSLRAASFLKEEERLTTKAHVGPAREELTGAQNLSSLGEKRLPLAKSRPILLGSRLVFRLGTPARSEKSRSDPPT